MQTQTQYVKQPAIPPRETARGSTLRKLKMKRASTTFIDDECEYMCPIQGNLMVRFNQLIYSVRSIYVTG